MEDIYSNDMEMNKDKETNFGKEQSLDEEKNLDGELTFDSEMNSDNDLNASANSKIFADNKNMNTSVNSEILADNKEGNVTANSVVSGDKKDMNDYEKSETFMEINNNKEISSSETTINNKEISSSETIINSEEISNSEVSGISEENISSEIIGNSETISNVEKVANVDEFNNRESFINGEESDKDEKNNKSDKKDKREKKKHKGLKRFLLTVLCGIIAGIIICVVVVGVNHIKKSKDDGIMSNGVEDELTESKDEKEENIPGKDVSKILEDDELLPITTSDYSAVARAVMPSVVSINCNIPVQQDFFFGFGSQTGNKEVSGTGFLIGQNNKEILIATNEHVVEGAKNISVTFIDGKMAEATVKGEDSFYDLAVISVNADDLEQSTIDSVRIARLGNSDNTKVGSVAIAIGNALGYGQSITIGYVSAINREIENDTGSKIEFIQTDTAINPGNSGGPLLNAYGEVIGINSAKDVGYEIEGMGYCIPISKAIPVINELMNRVELDEDEIGYLGIQGKDISEDYANSFGMPSGVYVYEVEKDSPAEQAGIYMGDIITSVNGRKLSSMNELREILSYIRCGSEIKVEISRKNRGEYDSKEISVTLGKRPEK